MCLIILNPSTGDAIPEQQLENAYISNNDGVGIAYAENGKLHMFKSVKRYTRMLRHYRRARRLGAEILIHFRYATAGVIADSTAHPFLIDSDYAFAHNGVLDGYNGVVQVPKNSKRSDTQIFIDTILNRLPTDKWLWDDSKVSMMEDLISFNKFAFLNKQGQWRILNENLGHWSNGNWFSNSSYKESAFYSYHGIGFGSESYDIKSTRSTIKRLPASTTTETYTSPKDVDWTAGMFVGETPLCWQCIEQEDFTNNQLPLDGIPFQLLTLCQVCDKILNDRS